jgi:hypothetical protein
MSFKGTGASAALVWIVRGGVRRHARTRLLVSEPERKTLSIVLQMLKQLVSRKLGNADDERFWQRSYFDFNVRSHEKEQNCWVFFGYSQIGVRSPN